MSIYSKNAKEMLEKAGFVDISQDYAYILPIKVELAEADFDSLINRKVAEYTGIP